MAGTTPIYQFPYPTQTDPVWQGAQQMEALARKVEEALNNTQVPAGINLNPPSAAAIRTGVQSIANASDTVITFQAAQWDSRPGGAQMYSSTGITIRTAGIYLVEGLIGWAGNANGKRAMKITKNSTSAAASVLARVDPANAWDNVSTLAGHVQLAANDVLRIVVAQDSGGALDAAAALFSLPRARLAATYVRQPTLT